MILKNNIWFFKYFFSFNECQISAKCDLHMQMPVSAWWMASRTYFRVRDPLTEHYFRRRKSKKNPKKNESLGSLCFELVSGNSAISFLGLNFSIELHRRWVKGNQRLPDDYVCKIPTQNLHSILICSNRFGCNIG